MAASALQQEGQSRLAGLLNLEGQQLVGPRPTQVHRGDWSTGTGRHLDETEARINHQRRADHQHGVGPAQMVRSSADYVARDGFSKEHDVGLERPFAVWANWYGKRGKVACLKIGIAVGRGGGFKVEPPRIQPTEVLLHFLTHQLPSATHAADQIEPAVKVDHALVAGGLVKPVHILRQNDLGI